MLTQELSREWGIPANFSMKFTYEKLILFPTNYNVLSQKCNFSGEAKNCFSRYLMKLYNSYLDTMFIFNCLFRFYDDYADILIRLEDM